MGIGEFLGDATFSVGAGIGNELTRRRTTEARKFRASQAQNKITNDRNAVKDRRSQASNTISTIQSVLGADKSIRNQLLGHQSVKDAMTQLDIDPEALPAIGKLGDENIKLLLEEIQEATGGSEEEAKQFLEGLSGQLAGKTVPEILLAIDPILKKRKARNDQKLIDKVGGVKDKVATPVPTSAAPVSTPTPSTVIDASSPVTDSTTVPAILTGGAGFASDPGAEKLAGIYAESLAGSQKMLTRKIFRQRQEIERIAGLKSVDPEKRQKNIDSLQKGIDSLVKQLTAKQKSDNAGQRSPTLNDVLASPKFKKAYPALIEQLNILDPKTGKGTIVIDGKKFSVTRKDILEDFLAITDFVPAAAFIQNLFREKNNDLALLLGRMVDSLTPEGGIDGTTP